MERKKQPMRMEGAYDGRDGALVAWEFAAYPKYNRGKLWYAAVVVGGLGLLLYAVFTANFLFALFILLFALVTYLNSVTEPPIMRCAITHDGVAIGEKLHQYRDLKNFWFVYEPPEVKCLYIGSSSVLQPRIAVDLADQDPNLVREALGQFLHEELAHQDEPFSDLIGRILKI